MHVYPVHPPAYVPVSLFFHSSSSSSRKEILKIEEKTREEGEKKKWNKIFLYIVFLDRGETRTARSLNISHSFGLANISVNN